MKTVLIFLLSVLSISCEEEKKSDCYRIGGTEAECENDAKCEYKYLTSEIVINGYQVGGVTTLLQKWEHTQNPTLVFQFGVCFDKFEKPEMVSDYNCCAEDPESGCCAAEKLEYYCYFIAQNLFIGTRFDQYNTDKIPPGWVQCVTLGLQESQLPECGNGIIEPGEQCDGDQLGTMESCAEHQAAVHPAFAKDAQYTAGEITCRVDCRWDFSGCVSAE